MQINRITRKVRLGSMEDAVRYQLITELVFLRKQSIIDTDLTYLTLLSMWGPISLKEFCHKAVVHIHGDGVMTDVEKHPVRIQTVRNRLGVLEKRGYVVKSGKGRKMLMVNPALELGTRGNILLEYNFLYVDTKESEGINSRSGQGVTAL